jgi:hypothetical protein
MMILVVRKVSLVYSNTLYKKLYATCINIFGYIHYNILTTVIIIFFINLLLYFKKHFVSQSTMYFTNFVTKHILTFIGGLHDHNKSRFI